MWFLIDSFRAISIHQEHSTFLVALCNTELICDGERASLWVTPSSESKQLLWLLCERSSKGRLAHWQSLLPLCKRGAVLRGEAVHYCCTI